MVATTAFWPAGASAVSSPQAVAFLSAQRTANGIPKATTSSAGTRWEWAPIHLYLMLDPVNDTETLPSSLLGRRG